MRNGNEDAERARELLVSLEEGRDLGDLLQALVWATLAVEARLTSVQFAVEEIALVVGDISRD